jgi:Tol biopolymer transport system component
VTKRGHAKVLDFGLAKVATETSSASQMAEAGTQTDTMDQQRLTSPGTVVGTISYMSPEQVRAKDLDARTDLFSFGAVLYEMATGTLPFRGESSGLIFEAILNRAPAVPLRLNPDLPAELERIINKALEKDRTMRYQVSAEMRADLLRLKREMGSGRVGEIGPDVLAITAKSGPSSQTPILQTSSVPVNARIPRATRMRWRVAPFAAGALLLVGFAVFLLRPPTHTQQPDKVTIVPITTYPGFEAAPSFSPDGNQIAFSWYHESESATTIEMDLYVKQIGNERAVRITNHEAVFLIPAWSPDGRNIAFAMTGKNGNGIYLVPALGGPERKLAKINENGWPWLLLSWSPDSRRVAFASDLPMATTEAPEHYRIHVLDVETGEERALPDPSPDCATSMEPAFSADGKYLASVCMLTEGINKIYVQSNGGGTAHEVTVVKGPSSLDGIAWTADSRSILYSAAGSLWRVPVTGGPQEKLPFGHDTQTPAIALTGHKLAYAETNGHRDIWRIQLASQTRAAGPASNFISSSRDQENPRISPDGKYIAFDSKRSGNSEVWVCDRDGSSPVQLSSFDGPSIGRPSWSPDSRRIVFDSRAAGPAELYIVSVEGGPPHKLPTGTPNASSPSWSGDGRWIYFATERPDAVWKVPIENGNAVRLTKEGRYDPEESADGKRVFYTVGGERNELWSVPVSGGDEQREEAIPGVGVAWTLAQNGVYFVDGSPSHYSINYFDFATKHVHIVSQLPGLSFIMSGIAVSRRSDTLLFSGVAHFESDIMMVEGFR